MSVTLHGAVVVLSVVGLPNIQRHFQVEDVPMVVELVTISNETNLPSQTEPDPPPKPKKDARKPVPPPAPAVNAQPPAPLQELEAVVAPPPKPALKAEPKTKTEPKRVFKSKVKPQAPKRFATAKPKRKPKPPDEFASVLKNLAKEFKKPPPMKKSEKNKEAEPARDNFEQQIAKVLTRRRVSDAASNRVTMTERHAMINSIRTAIQPCWNIQPGAKGAQDIVVVVRATMSPNGRVRRAWVTNRSAFQNDPFKLAAAETAQRAVLNQACQPFELDPKKYDVWKDVTLSFNPSEMFGR